MSCLQKITASIAARLGIQDHVTGCIFIGCRHFHVSQTLSSEPFKKKKRFDPQLQAEREKKQIKKLEREIKRVRKHGEVLKPVEEQEMDFWLRNETELRKRDKQELSFEESEYRALLHKDWSRYKLKQSLNELQVLQQAQRAQTKALAELRKESEELYQKAIQIDEDFIPQTFMGPYLTPPIEDYYYPDGEYNRVVKEY